MAIQKPHLLRFKSLIPCGVVIFKTPSLAEGVFASANASQPVGWGWVFFVILSVAKYL
ncbi:hypothetical protein [Helicobacter sp. T3_23-1059]